MFRINKTYKYRCFSIGIGACLLMLYAVTTLAKDEADPIQWLAVKDTDLQIVPGSVLDFSDLFGPTPKPQDNPIGINNEGHLALAGGKGKRIRFLGAPLVFVGPHGGFPDHDAADGLAKQLRMHGYNLARLHFVDATLMKGAKHDFDYDSEQLDRFHYLLAALKDQGIYWMIDAATSWDGAYVDTPENSGKRNIRLDIHIKKSAQEHWKRMVTSILGVKNPYTRQPTLKDPALAVVTLVNENGLDYLTREGYSPDLLEPFRAWLLQNYNDINSLRETWQDDTLHEVGDIQLPPQNEASPRQTDLLRFFTDLERATLNWASDFLRKQGYQGLITSYNNGRSVRSRIIGKDLDLITQHGYYDHPSSFIRPGSEINNNSSLENLIPYVTDFASSRHGGKPFIVDEYDHVFWNSWRREAGLAVPAYASLQDWDGIARFANPVTLNYGKSKFPRDQAIHSFAIGLDPIARAGETLAALLYRRVDVKPALSKVAIALDEDAIYVKKFSKWRPMSDSLSRISLSTGLGLYWPNNEDSADKNIAWKPDISVKFSLNQFGVLGNALENASMKLGVASSSAGTEQVSMLKKAHILAAGNSTDPARGVYQSDTGEILMETAERRMRVVTPNTEAVVFDRGLPLTLSKLEVNAANGPALVAVSSVDGNPLTASSRILVIVATNALNSGMHLSADGTTLHELGKLPVLMRSGRVDLTLHHNSPENLELYSVKLNGKRGDKIPVELLKDGLHFSLDTNQLSHGPTTYFEIIERDNSRNNKKSF